MPRYWLAAAVSTVAASACLVVPASAQATPALHWRDCKVKEGQPPPPKEVRCAALSVPADWANGRGEVTLELARRTATKEKLGTVIYLPGGPGDSGVDQLLAKNRLSDAAAERFDVVTLDPRGTNRSDPVRCDPAVIDRLPDFNPDTGGTLAASVKYGRDVEASCEPKSRELFGHLDSRSIARDVEAIRAALGEKQVSLYSRSYGTLAAQTYADMFPRRVRAVVLDSVFDHSQSTRELIESSGRAVEDSFNAFARWCAATESCALHGKDVGAIFDDLYRKAERGELVEPSTPAVKIAATDLSWLTMRRFLYGPAYPALADRLASLAGLVPPGAPLAFPKSNGLFTLATFCADHRNAFRSEFEWRWQWARMKAQAPHMRTHMVWQITAICAGWPYPVTNPQHKPDIRASVLLINSRNDVATPHEWAVNVSRMIPRSALLTYEGAGHGIYGRTACIDQVTDRYLIDLVLPAPGASCPSA